MSLRRLRFWRADQSFALEESILAWFPTQKGFQHVHSICGAASLKNHLPVLSSDLKQDKRSPSHLCKPGRWPQTKGKERLAHLWIQNALLFKATEKHVGGVDLAPQVAVVLAVVSSCQVAEAGRHVGACGEGTCLSTAPWWRNIAVVDELTWCSWNPQDLLAVLCKHLCGVCSGAAVQRLVHFAQHHLSQVHEPWTQKPGTFIGQGRFWFDWETAADLCWPLWRLSACPACPLGWERRPCSGRTVSSGAPSPKSSSRAPATAPPRSPSPPGFHWILKTRSDAYTGSDQPRSHKPIPHLNQWWSVIRRPPWSRSRASRDRTRGSKSPPRGAAGERAILSWAWWS